MDWIRRSAGDAGAWHVNRLVFVILAAAGAIVLATVGGACGHANVASQDIAASRAAGSSGSGCPTQGVGGDSLAPLCASSAGASTGGTNGTTGPASATASPRPAVPVPTGSSPTSSSGPGIQGPITPSPTAPITPSGLGISGPAVPTSPPPIPPSTVPPQVTAISPASGAGAGGDSVTITGSGFTGATKVDFGSSSAAMTVVSDTEITVTSPPGSGTVDVTVVTPNGTSATSPADQFSYQG